MNLLTFTVNPKLTHSKKELIRITSVYLDEINRIKRYENELYKDTNQAFSHTIVFFPEFYLRQPSYRFPGTSITENSEIVEFMKRKASKLGIYIGSGLFEYDEKEKKKYLSGVIINSKGELKKQRKIHLASYDIEKGISPGNDISPIETEFGIIGILVCKDIFAPEIARILAIKGSEIFYHPRGFIPQHQQSNDFTENWIMREKARAADNISYLVSSTNVVHGTPTAEIINFDGRVFAQLQGEGILYHILNLDTLRFYRREKGPFHSPNIKIGERKPQIYGFKFEQK